MTGGNLTFSDAGHLKAIFRGIALHRRVIALHRRVKLHGLNFSV